jgi:predicted CXXCH cytochrome family protein
MKLLLVTQSIGHSGKPRQTRRTIEALAFRVGREAGSEIHLADKRVALQEGIISNRGGAVFTRGEGKPGTGTTRKAVSSVRMKEGQPLNVGPYQLTALAAPAGYDLAIRLEMVAAEDPATAFGERAGRRTLAALGLPKRGAAWVLVLLVTAFALLIPAVKPLHLPLQQVAEALPRVSDRWWNPGPLMRAHQPIADKCEACHDEAFRRVKDAACLACHRNIGDHAPAGFRKAGLFAEDRCASCHLDHKGPRPLHRDSDQGCIGCHQDIRAVAAASKTHAVADFARHHPQFRLTLPAAAGAPKARVRMGEAALAEASGLIFPHAVHLDAKGIRSPGRGRVTMNCADCHAPDATGRTFQPIEMKRHCQECHRLEFEPAVTDREVPHGDPREAARTISEFYAHLALNGTRDSFSRAFGVDNVGLLQRAGKAETERPALLAMADAKASRVTRELIEVRACGLCHQVSASEVDGTRRWQVTALARHVRTGHSWMPKARFDHKPHAQSRCGTCHAVATSTRSEDIAMPSIAVCRDCHAGKAIEEKKLSSNCLMCHGFHVEGHKWPSHMPMPMATGVVRP